MPPRTLQKIGLLANRTCLTSILKAPQCTMHYKILSLLNIYMYIVFTALYTDGPDNGLRAKSCLPVYSMKFVVKEQ